MKKINILVLLFAVVFFACKGNPKKNNQEVVDNKSTEIVDKHTSEVALDWNGTYKGTLPCASCPGILTTVKLNNDKTFEMEEVYLEEEDGTVLSKGTFTFTEDGNKVVLSSEQGNTIYAVGENKLILLGEDGKKSVSELSEEYELKKVK
ncbi:MAG: copper resistance protein NlpE N-terminal domain-containing protein [Tenacibaculum sp.]|nr:copper resistance protein NlpE N-terminal domain-containing protein [Tenacibaculum sp.]